MMPITWRDVIVFGLGIVSSRICTKRLLQAIYGAMPAKRCHAK